MIGRDVEPKRLGKVLLIEKIASGGMAEIYVAKSEVLPGFDKIIVCKRILPRYAAEREFIHMFLDEARIAATLHHPNIVQMFDVASSDGEYYITMEYLYGEDLRHILREITQRGELLPYDHAIAALVGVCAGLHYAHDKADLEGHPLRIVHRDVSPQNVIITYDGAVKIVDFGVAKATNRINETQSGLLKGKIPYMSPEQCLAQPLDRRSDVFAAGILLYEVTTCRRLFKGKNEFEIMRQIVEGEPKKPSELREDYPPGLEAIVMKALARDLDERYQSAQELQVALEEFARQERLALSSVGLANYLQRTLGRRPETWRSKLEGFAGEATLPTALTPSQYPLANSATQTVATGPPQPSDFADPNDVLGRTPSIRGEVADWRPSSHSVTHGESPSQPPRKRAVPIAMSVIAALGLAFLGVRQFSRVPSTSPDPAPMPAASPPAPSPQTSLPTPTAPSPTIPEVAASGYAKISTKPDGATLTVDGSRWPDRSPAIVDRLMPGRHVVRAELRGYRAEESTFDVRADKTTTLDVKLVRADARVTPSPSVTPTPASTGTLRVASMPSCELFVDGKSYGYTPVPNIVLPVGKHSLRLVNGKFRVDERSDVTITAGAPTTKRFEFNIADKD